MSVETDSVSNYDKKRKKEINKDSDTASMLFSAEENNIVCSHYIKQSKDISEHREP